MSRVWVWVWVRVWVWVWVRVRVWVWVRVRMWVWVWVRVWGRTGMGGGGWGLSSCFQVVHCPRTEAEAKTARTGLSADKARRGG